MRCRCIFIGETGVAGINAIAPITAIVTFFGDLGSTGVGIVFAREIGAMRKHRADEIYGQGLIIGIGMGLISALLIVAIRDVYFAVSGITDDILEKRSNTISSPPCLPRAAPTRRREGRAPPPTRARRTRSQLSAKLREVHILIQTAFAQVDGLRTLRDP